MPTPGSLFLGDGDPGCGDACDSNDDSVVDISDSITTLGVLFLGQGTIPRPGMNDCGVDPTDDEVVFSPSAVGNYAALAGQRPTSTKR